MTPTQKLIKESKACASSYGYKNMVLILFATFFMIKMYCDSYDVTRLVTQKQLTEDPIKTCAPSVRSKTVIGAQEPIKIVLPSSLPVSWKPRCTTVGEGMNFLDERYPTVFGWFCEETRYAVLHLMRMQLMAGIGGGMGEIGVHHGKVTSFLAFFARQDDIEKKQLFAADLFEGMQDQNVDRSGSGDSTIFKKNIEVANVTMDDFQVFIGPSQTIDSPSYFTTKKIQPFRMFSVDGGHTKETTLADLFTIEKHISQGGIIMLDDFLRDDWWGVTEAAIAYAEEGGTLVPFAFVANKLFYTTPSHHEYYMNAIQKSIVCTSTGLAEVHDESTAVRRTVIEFFGELAWCGKSDWITNANRPVPHEEWVKEVKAFVEYFD